MLTEMPVNEISTPESSAARHEFTMDPGLLVSVIKSQAGTLSKALLEGIMNSIDAEATRVDVTVTAESFRIEDNGRGFASEEDIRLWFGRFGTPHKEGDAIYGRFRMGRGQMMAFAITEWLSGPYRMLVDIEEKGLSYELESVSADEVTKGCVINGTLYQALTEHKLADVLTELKKFVAYTPKPVYVNGELYGAPAARLKTWTFEDEDAWYKVVQDATELQVYNLGVFVEDMGNWRVGMGGVVVSKRQLEVNFARNSVLEDKCPAWKRIATKLEAMILAKLSDAKKLDDGERKFLARRLNVMRALPGVDMLKAKVLTDPSGKHLALGDLRHFTRFVHVPESGPLACAAHGEAGTFVVTDDLLSRFGSYSLDDWLRTMQRYSGVLNPGFETIDAEKIAHLGLGGALNLDADGLTIRERAAFKALERLNELLSANLAAAGYTSTTRQLLVGKHKSGKRDAFVAWTDGKTYITANKKFLKLFERGLDGVLEWLQTLVHEYMHDTDDSESHSHGEVFYRKFHDAVFTNSSLSMASLAQLGLIEYLAQLVKAGGNRPRGLMRQLKPRLGTSMNMDESS